MDGIYKAERGTAKVEAGGAKLASNSHPPQSLLFAPFYPLINFPIELDIFL
jgi:hypothetical protein